jgi:Flp pilus assembly pilin Flp
MKEHEERRMGSGEDAHREHGIRFAASRRESANEGGSRRSVGRIVADREELRTGPAWRESREGSSMISKIRLKLLGDGGQDLIEYGLLGAFISVVSILAIQAIGPLVNDLYVAIQNAITP